MWWSVVVPGFEAFFDRERGRRWPVEEDFRPGKTDFGLADSQVRHYTALTRHLALAMAALAVCATTAALARPPHQHAGPPAHLTR